MAAQPGCQKTHVRHWMFENRELRRMFVSKVAIMTGGLKKHHMEFLRAPNEEGRTGCHM